MGGQVETHHVTGGRLMLSDFPGCWRGFTQLIPRDTIPFETSRLSLNTNSPVLLNYYNEKSRRGP